MQILAAPPKASEFFLSKLGETMSLICTQMPSSSTLKGGQEISMLVSRLRSISRHAIQCVPAEIAVDILLFYLAVNFEYTSPGSSPSDCCTLATMP